LGPFWPILIMMGLWISPSSTAGLRAARPLLWRGLETTPQQGRGLVTTPQQGVTTPQQGARSGADMPNETSYS
jgi:hypothetical protein